MEKDQHVWTGGIYVYNTCVYVYTSPGEMPPDTCKYGDAQQLACLYWSTYRKGRISVINGSVLVPAEHRGTRHLRGEYGAPKVVHILPQLPLTPTIDKCETGRLVEASCAGNLFVFAPNHIIPLLIIIQKITFIHIARTSVLSNSTPKSLLNVLSALERYVKVQSFRRATSASLSCA